MNSNQKGEIFAVEGLAGLEKGKNALAFKARGKPGLKLIVEVKYTDLWKDNVQKFELEFTEEDWQDFTCELQVPENASLCNIIWSNSDAKESAIAQPSLHP